jgi:PBP1b-binding outer membrane lipoprotein LpoB
MKISAMKTINALLLILIISGCSSAGPNRGQRPLNEGPFTVMMPPFVNATDNEHAGQALTQLTGSALLERRIPLYQTEEVLTKTDEDSPGKEGRYVQIARDSKATYLLVGTVHEYRYKSDLNANPAVGVTLRLVNVQNGRTVWQGSSSKVGHAFSSLTSTAQKAVQDLVRQIPLKPYA